MESSSPFAAATNFSSLARDLRAVQSLELIKRQQVILVCVIHGEHVLSVVCGFPVHKVEVVDLFEFSLAKETILVDIISCEVINCELFTLGDWFLFLIALSTEYILEFLSVQFIVMVQIILGVELLYSLLAVLTVEIIDIGKLALADQVVVIGVELVQDCQCLLWAHIVVVMHAATVSVNFTEQMLKLIEGNETIYVVVIISKYSDHVLFAVLAVNIVDDGIFLR
jgi:hypothetical protein